MSRLEEYLKSVKERVDAIKEIIFAWSFRGDAVKKAALEVTCTDVEVLLAMLTQLKKQIRQMPREITDIKVPIGLTTITARGRLENIFEDLEDLIPDTKEGEL